MEGIQTGFQTNWMWEGVMTAIVDRAGEWAIVDRAGEWAQPLRTVGQRNR
jgi:hypothetical protein